ncbi:MAG: PIN domain-containing protein [Methanobacteriota archaeon]
MNKLFLDTTIIISSLLPDRSEHIACVSILLQNKIPLLTNEYVVKETQRVLEQVYSFDQADINQFIEFISTKLEIVKTPSKEEFSNIKSNDKSDRPIIYSAKKHHCVLITDDILTKKDALNYVMTFHSNEAIEVFEIKLAKMKNRG